MSARNKDIAWAKDCFLGDFLGKSVYRLADPHRAKEAIAAINQDQAWMIETKVSVDALNTLTFLTDLGFRLIDTNVQLDRLTTGLFLPSSLPTEVQVRDACNEDRTAVERIAAENLLTSRFHLDEKIGPEIGSRIKRAWVGNYFEGCRGDRLLVVVNNGKVGGFLLVLERGPLGIIDLVALDSALRGLGALGALVNAWFAKTSKIERVLVGTQIVNFRSLRAYGKLGFRVCSATHVLHCHGPSSPI
jgi:hypothetical protein